MTFGAAPARVGAGAVRARLKHTLHASASVGGQCARTSPEIFQLTGLTSLSIGENNLGSVPPEIGRLKQLDMLDLHTNGLTSVPPELGQLSNLALLYLNNNRLTKLPPELGRLTKLTELALTGNPLKRPPPEVVNQGTRAVLTYLRARLESEPAP